MSNKIPQKLDIQELHVFFNLIPKICHNYLNFLKNVVKSIVQTFLYKVIFSISALNLLFSFIAVLKFLFT